MSGDLVVEGILVGDLSIGGIFVVERGGSAQGSVKCREGAVGGAFCGTLEAEGVVRILPGASISGRVLAKETLFEQGEDTAQSPQMQQLPEEETRPSEGGVTSLPSFAPTAAAEAEPTPAQRIPLVTGSSRQVVVKPTSILKGNP